MGATEDCLWSPSPPSGVRPFAACSATGTTKLQARAVPNGEESAKPRPRGIFSKSHHGEVPGGSESRPLAPMASEPERSSPCPPNRVEARGKRDHRRLPVTEEISVPTNFYPVGFWLPRPPSPAFLAAATKRGRPSPIRRREMRVPPGHGPKGLLLPRCVRMLWRRASVGLSVSRWRHAQTRRPTHDHARSGNRSDVQRPWTPRAPGRSVPPWCGLRICRVTADPEIAVGPMPSPRGSSALPGAAGIRRSYPAIGRLEHEDLALPRSPGRGAGRRNARPVPRVPVPTGTRFTTGPPPFVPRVELENPPLRRRAPPEPVTYELPRRGGLAGRPGLSLGERERNSRNDLSASPRFAFFK